MSDVSRRHENYRPTATIEAPPIYRWPLQLSRSLAWLLKEFLVPWGLFWIALALVSWRYLTPDYSQMATLQFDWIAAMWLRNAGLLIAIAGLLHWRLHMRRAQGKEFKFDSRWLATNTQRFLFRDQARENVFWSLVSGVTFWTAWEALTLWACASGTVDSVTWASAPIYLGALLVLTFFWSSVHFDLAHRPLHWRPVYRFAHALHHKNVNTGPWSGISMHPLEHVIYFSVFLLWWVVPADPIVITLTGFFQALSPAVSHCGFARVRLGRNMTIPAGTHFHTLHHQLFDINFGQQLTPTDKLFATWHDGTNEAHAAFERRK